MALHRSITLQEFLVAARISRSRFYALMKAGDVPRTIVIGRHRLMLEADANHWIERRYGR